MKFIRLPLFFSFLAWMEAALMPKCCRSPSSNLIHAHKFKLQRKEWEKSGFENLKLRYQFQIQRRMREWFKPASFIHKNQTNLFFIHECNEWINVFCLSRLLLIQIPAYKEAGKMPISCRGNKFNLFFSGQIT